MAGGGPRVDIKEAFLTCSICMEPFRRPKILPCVHTFCRHCLASYLDSGAASKKRGGFPCPTCRQHVPIAKPAKPPHTWPDQVKDNFVMSSMLEVLDKQRVASPTPPPSSPSPTAHAALQPSADAAVGESEAAVCTCPSGGDTVCWDCAVVVCCTCARTKHADCRQVQNVRQAGPERRQEILDWLPRVNGRLAQLRKNHDSAQTTVHSLLARRDVTQGQITQAARDAIQMVRLQEHTLKEKVATKYEVLLRHHRQRQNAASAEIDTLTSLREALEYVVAEDDAELLRQTHSLSQRYNDVMRTVGGESEDGEAMQLQETETFVAASLSDLQSVVLVGSLQSGVAETPARPVSTSPSDSESSCFLPEGPFLSLPPRRDSHPATPPPSSTRSTRRPPDSGPPSPSSGVTSTSDCPGPAVGLAMPGDRETDSTAPVWSGPGDVTCRLMHSFSARTKADRTQPVIRDMAVVGSGWIIATDTANRCVKVFFKAAEAEAERKQQCKRLELASAPYGVSSMEGCVAAVTVPKERHIMLVAARPHPVPLATLALPADLQHPLWALTSLGPQRLALTACPPGQPALVVLVQVGADRCRSVASFSSPVKTPLYVAAKGQSLVLTDPTSSDVACVSDTGHLVFHTHTEGKAMGVACHAQTVLVVDQSPALTVLNGEGCCLHRLPLPTGKAGCPHPRALAVGTRNTIYVSDDDGRIHLFHLVWRDSD